MSWFYQTPERKTADCSFCKRSYRDVGALVEGPGSVFICLACIQQCGGVIEEERGRLAGNVKAFMVAGATYRFTTDTATRIGVVRTRLAPPHDHWIQVELTGTDAGDPSETTWINLLHVHTVSEVGTAQLETPPAPAAAPVTEFRPVKFRRGTER